MEHPVLKAVKRQIAEKSKLKKLRNENKLPAVVYGKDLETTSITIDEKELSQILKTRGETALINLKLEDESYPVLIKEVQRNILKNAIDHVDFFNVSMHEEVEYDLPIIVVGKAKGAEMGGVLQQQKRELAVKSLPGDMLDNIEIDVSDMEIGDTLTVADLKIDETNTILDDLDEVIVTLLLPSIEEEEEEDVEVTEDDVEPELVGADEEEEEAAEDEE